VRYCHGASSPLARIGTKHNGIVLDLLVEGDKTFEGKQ
jgi:hypothetical protein